ncbi:AsmA family protein [Pseudooceanicola batsensis HTCC2597]|uniref:AsmA family protein n=1 Tax=Pseudooceanicola batsensis (strain ATCC BAA-863 / DSM 15984 / KCTC 12145 / HTCC2597) TaxID=252305 RepID=A3TTE2_PSEBH|nr:AsmA family protein [Pseudooceanicola batsensis]EAQ04919.1 AsmA family protein [Pseudooceanicola batsensis HTCC2597]
MRLIRLVIGMIIAFSLVFVAGLFLVPGERIAQVAADELGRRTGREVRIGGEARFTLWPDLGVTVDGLRIANADWSDNGPMFQAQRVTIGVDAAALIRRDIRIRTLHAEAPQILLERNADGEGNWEVGGKAAVAATEAQPSGAAPAATAAAPVQRPAFTIDDAVITGASVYFADHRTGTEVSQRDIDLTVAYPEARGPARIDLTLRPNGAPIRLSGTIADPRAFAEARISPVVFDLEAPSASGRFEGRASVGPEAEGALSLDIADTGALARALGRADPGLSRGLGRDLDLAAQVTLTRVGLLALREGRMSSGGNAATVAADLTTGGPRPRLNARVDAGPLDLSALTAGGAPASVSGGGAARSGWSTAPIDAGSLNRLDGEIAISAPSLDLGTTEIGQTRVLVTIDRARAVATLRELRAFGGLVTGEFVANNRNGLSVGGDLRAADIALDQALTELAGVTRFTGSAAARVRFLGVGQSVAAIINSLSGDGGIDTGRGTIRGIDLDRLFRGGDPSGGTTIFDETRATFSMEDGVLSNTDLLMTLGGIEARGEGTVGLGERRIDYLFTPVSLKARDGRGIALPVWIRGPWSAPRITVDVEKAIQLNAAEEKAAFEQKLRDRVRDELGIEQRDGESTEDALKRTLEEEARKGLLKLFDR